MCSTIKSLRSRVLVTLLFASFTWAQVDRAGLNGTVTDPSGRMLPGVYITATQDATGLRRETRSSAKGSYDLPELPVGVYTVTFASSGFQPLLVKNVVQTVGHTRTLDIALKVAGTQERVDVQGSSLELNETSDSLGARLEREQVQNLPLNGRN